MLSDEILGDTNWGDDGDWGACLSPGLRLPASFRPSGCAGEGQNKPQIQARKAGVSYAL
jgi:hypothetical protein